MQGISPYLKWIQMFSLYWGIATVLFLALFLYFWIKEPRRLLNGTLFTIFFVSFLGELALLIFSTANLKFIFVMGVLFLILAVLLFLILLFAWFLLLWNALIVWKRESHTLSNMLTLFLALALISIWLINFFAADRSQFLPPWLNIFLSGLPLIGVYLSFCAFNYLISAFIYQFVPKHYKENYLIVLGAGLINGDKVSKLLGSRIDSAISYAKKQSKKNHPLPKIVFSGGQGPDEKLSEAQAMANYAIDHGWDENLIILEDKSRNTLQNMAFSKKVILADVQDEPVKTKFFSNNYHIFRASLYAKMAGLKANGVGSKTRLYFLPNALIREFIAVFLINKKRHFIMLTLILILIIILTGVSIYLGIVSK